MSPTGFHVWAFGPHVAAPFILVGDYAWRVHEALSEWGQPWWGTLPLVRVQMLTVCEENPTTASSSWWQQRDICPAFCSTEPHLPRLASSPPCSDAYNKRTEFLGCSIRVHIPAQPSTSAYVSLTSPFPHCPRQVDPKTTQVSAVMETLGGGLSCRKWVTWGYRLALLLAGLFFLIHPDVSKM